MRSMVVTNDKLTHIPVYEYHFKKVHIFVNPNRGTILSYLAGYEELSDVNSKRIKRDHKVHIFISWITIYDIEAIHKLIKLCNVKCGKVIIHVPRSADKVTREYIDRSLHLCNGIRYKYYVERDSSHTIFKQTESSTIDIYSIYNHKYKLTLKF